MLSNTEIAWPDGEVPGCRTSQWTDRCLVLARMGRLWDIKLPGWLWIFIFVLVYIVIKNPAVGMWFLSLPARLISGIGNFFIGIGRSYGAP
jgi:hypothetical protein